MGCLEGKVAIVTGAAQGQGAAEAELFASEGAHVVVADIRDGTAVADDVGNGAFFQNLDISSSDDWGRAVARTLDTFGQVDILVNNAAIHWVKSFEEETAESFDRMLSINLRGPFLGIKAVAPAMRQAGGGSIVNIASTDALKPHAGNVAYGISKWGVRGLTQAAALAFAADGIRVNTILPGGVNTPMAQAAIEVLRGVSSGEAKAMLDSGGSATPSELAEVALFLASSRSSFVTGAELVADGGMTIGASRAPHRVGDGE